MTKQTLSFAKFEKKKIIILMHAYFVINIKTDVLYIFNIPTSFPLR